jgi:hypothetical protein
MAIGSLNIVQAPVLDGDLRMAERFGHKVSPNGKLERRIVANLIAHLAAAGFEPCAVDDGGEVIKAHDAKSAMETIFSVDDAWLLMRKAGGKRHAIALVLGNGIDVVSDWNYSEGDADGFNAAMDAFDAEAFA